MGTNKKSKRRTPLTDEGRENQLVSAAIDLAESQIRSGTASSQVITHFLKLGSSRERLEQERLRRENELLSSKIEMMASAKRIEELYEAALNSMRMYSGEITEDELAEQGEEDYDQ